MYDIQLCSTRSVFRTHVWLLLSFMWNIDKTDGKQKVTRFKNTLFFYPYNLLVFMVF